MEINQSFYRTGINYKPNLLQQEGQLVQQFKDLIDCEELGVAQYKNNEELHKKILESIESFDNDDENNFEYELSKDAVEELLAWAVFSNNIDARSIINASKAMIAAIKQGYKVWYFVNK